MAALLGTALAVYGNFAAGYISGHSDALSLHRGARRPLREYEFECRAPHLAPSPRCVRESRVVVDSRRWIPQFIVDQYTRAV